MLAIVVDHVLREKKKIGGVGEYQMNERTAREQLLKLYHITRSMLAAEGNKPLNSLA
jgi:hypothetical protein